MKTRHLLTLVATAILVGACIPSVNPFYTSKDVVFETSLLGEWREKGREEGAEMWRFEKSGETSYTLFVTEKENKTGKFSARLFKLKDNLFLDIIPDDCSYGDNQAGLVAAAMYPGHLLVRVSRMDSELKLAFFNFDWLQKYLEANPKALQHHLEDKRILLTAPTSDLQKFVLKHLGDGELFDKSGEMVRKEAATK